SQIQHLIYLLLRFQNLTADTLTISNVQPDNHIISTFDLKTLKDSSTENPLFHLNVKTLILDNVDETIIYRIFSRYIFADQIEIHILNQYFQNLAIAQILSLPIGRPISRLVLNDFAELNEVRYYRKPDTNEGFSLFKYIKEFKDKNKSDEDENEDDKDDKNKDKNDEDDKDKGDEDDKDKGDEDKNKNTNDEAGSLKQDLGLHKLCLLVSKAENSSYSSVLTELTSHGIHNVIDLDKSEANSTITRLNQTIMVENEILDVHGVTVDLLKSDLALYQQPSQLQSNPNQPRQPQQKFLRKLSLDFCKNQNLTKADLIIIIQWALCRFKNLLTMKIVEVNISNNEQKEITTHAYWTETKYTLHQIQIIPTKPNQPPINLIIRSLRNCILTSTTKHEHDFIVASSTTLAHLSTHPKQPNTHPNQPNDPIHQHITLNSFFQFLSAHHLKSTTTPILTQCIYCSRVPYMATSTEEPATNNPHLHFNPSIHFNALCYFNCVHPICNHCLFHCQAQQQFNCPICQYPYTCQYPYQLIIIRLSHFIFTRPTPTTPPPRPEWLADPSTPDSQVYLCVPHHSLNTLTTELNAEAIHIHTRRHYIIYPPPQ
ncbi:hypothetical protein NEHOM01_2339, partial [Nematocida homosporus]|uniref:uncharacterized protein n=1 Tax=Nematocida homosporus TaxID=1912981 RepID=UPI002220F893